MRSSGEERRVRLAEQRRQGILEAAANVFSQKGYDRATTREIAAEADVSEGTIYNYFPSKQALVDALVEVVRGHFLDLLTTPPSGDNYREGVTLAIERILTVIGEHAAVIRGLVTALWDQASCFQGYLIPGSHDLISAVKRYLDLGIASGRLWPCDTEAAARMLMGMVIFLAIPYMRGVEPVPPPETLHAQADMLAHVLIDGLKNREV
jgi:AcrR family transcriptional regulator